MNVVDLDPPAGCNERLIKYTMNAGVMMRDSRLPTYLGNVVCVCLHVDVGRGSAAGNAVIELDEQSVPRRSSALSPTPPTFDLRPTRPVSKATETITASASDSRRALEGQIEENERAITELKRTRTH